MTAGVVVAATAAALAASLTLRAPPSVESGPARGPMARLFGVVAAGVAVLTVGSIRIGLLALVVGAAVWAGRRLWRTGRAARLARDTSSRVLESCEQLVAELAGGQPPGKALALAASEWAELAPVAEAHRVGADVPNAWREVAARPGAADLRVVAAAWQVSYRTGEGLADTLEQVSRELRATQLTRRIVAGELASARATARLVGVLPVLALTVGSGAGGDPWGFLLGHPVGLGCLALGLGFAIAGLAWIEALGRRVTR